jgi:hypothetical protein
MHVYRSPCTATTKAETMPHSLDDRSDAHATVNAEWKVFHRC